MSLNSDKEAIAVARQGSPDVILLDIILGDSDGRTLCRRMKQDPVIGDIPVVLYSAGNITQRSIEESGATAFVQKPFDLFDMIARLKTVAAAPRTS
jgi:CheY-like chemotaxis protein